MKGELGARAARRLPAGTHGIPPELVARNQRERLIAAIAEACAERGYAEVSVTDVAKRAGVSTVTFYRQFADKQECMLAAHRALLGRLLEEVDRACAGANGQGRKAGEEAGREEDPDARAGAGSAPGPKVRAGIRKALSLLAADAPAARLLTVEILAVGPEGMKRHDAAVEAIASRLRATAASSGYSSSRAGGEGSSGQAFASQEWVLVAGIFALVGKLVTAGEAKRLPGLEDKLVATLSLQSRA